MINFWIFTVIVALLMGILGGYLYADIVSGVLITISTLFVLFVIGAFAFLITVSGYENVEHSDYEVVENVISLKDNSYSNTEGTVGGTLFFFYGSSRTEDGIVYHTMSGTDEEGYLINSLKAESTYLFLDGDENPNIVYKYRETTHLGNWFFGGLFKYIPQISTELIKTELHIPKDAVELDFSVDME